MSPWEVAMATKAHRIRETIAKLSRAKNARRYPPGLRARVIAYAKARLAAGGTVAAVCRELDVGAPTLYGFLGIEGPKEKGRPGFKRVRVVRAPPPESGSRRVLRGPFGMVVEGLTLDEISQLLRGLSCSV
jgi:hypothetical protein